MLSIIKIQKEPILEPLQLYRGSQRFKFSKSTLFLLLQGRMPKLTKHADLYGDDPSKSYQFQKDDSISINYKDESSSRSQSSSEEKIKNNKNLSKQKKEIASKEQRTKKSDQTKKKQGGNKKTKKQKIERANDILKKMQQEYCDQDTVYSENETPTDIPQEALLLNSKKKKKKGNIAKIKNKFFDIEVDGDLSNKLNTCSNSRQFQSNGLIIKEKNEEEIKQRNEQWKHKIEEKAIKIKNKLDFKSQEDDPKYREFLQKKLNEVAECEQVNIVIEVPKIFKGANARHADAAIYLKNISKEKSLKDQIPDEENNTRTNESCQSQSKQKKIDRNQFFSQFDRELRFQRVSNFSKQIFKKSSFDEIQADLQKHSYLLKKRDSTDRNSKNLSNSISRSRLSSKSLSNKNSPDSHAFSRKSESLQKKKASQIKQRFSGKQIDIVKQENKETSNSEQREIKNGQPQADEKKNEDQIVIKEKKGQNKSQKKKEKSKKKKQQQEQRKQQKKNKMQKKLRRQVESLFENEAQDSQQGYGDDGYSTGSDKNYDEKQFQDLIDNKDIEFIKKNQKIARKIYLQKQAKDDEEALQRIKDRILNPRKIKCQQNSESRRRRRQRIEACKKKFEKEDGDQNALFVEDKYQDEQKNENENDVNDFEQQLKYLQEEVGLKESREKENIKGSQQKESVERSKKKRVAKNIWKNVKSITREKTGEKRGGFIRKQGTYAGNNLNTGNKRRKSNEKQINFEN